MYDFSLFPNFSSSFIWLFQVILPRQKHEITQNNNFYEKHGH